MSDALDSPLSVLVVEDDTALRTLFTALLSRQGFQTECVTDGTQALKRLAQQRYSAVLLDLMMPVKNGFDVLDVLSKTRPGLLSRIIVTTGVSDRDLRKVDRNRVFAILRKPFDIDQLVSTIRACAGRSRDEDSNDHKGDSGGVDDATRIHQAVQRFENVLPKLRRMLSTEATLHGELMLRQELRRVVGRIAGVMAQVAASEHDPVRAQRFELTRQRAALFAGMPADSFGQEH